MSNAGKRRTVLIVDDEAQLRDMLSSVLKLEGYPLEMAANGQEAIDILQRAPQVERVMLLDLLMPIMEGSGVVRWLVEHPDVRAKTKIILMSANHNLRSAMDLVHDGELPKPFGVDSMLETISQAA